MTNALIDLKTVKKILKRVLKGDPDMRGVFLFDSIGKLMAHIAKVSIDSVTIEKLGKNTSTIFDGYRKFGTIFNLGDFHWTSSEFSEHGRITIIPVGTHVMCLIGDYCPNVGMIRLILSSVRNQLIEAIEKY